MRDFVQNISNIIGGAHAAPSGSARHRAINPSDTSDVIADHPLSSLGDAETAIAAARAATKAWAGLSPVARGEVLLKAGSLLRQRAEPVAQQMSREIGKPIGEARAEAFYAAKVLEFYAAEGPRLSGEALPSGRPGVVAFTERRPLGVVGQITPWNFPLSIPAWKLGPALIAGNAVVWKPCLQAPFTSQALAETLHEAGLPPGVANLVHGDGPDVGQAIVDHPEVNAISFTGSREVGFRVHRAASARRAKVQCELGGKNPLVVLDDAALDLAVTTAIEGAFRNAGQKCTATSRIILQLGIRKRFTEAFVEQARGLKLGDARHPDTFLGPLVDAKQYDKVRGYIEIGLKEGAKLLCGGANGANRSGYFVAPTVFDEVTSRMTIAREEIFGPVVTLFGAASFEEAVALANDTEYGLSASICTNDLGRAHAFLNQVEVGVGAVNLPTAGVELHAPFGGTKASGIGVKEQGRPVIDFYSEWRTNYLKVA
jgi:alpha-ketoglutaric semialdehyde dehydrogenase